MKITLALLLSFITLTSVSQDFGKLCSEGIRHITGKNYEKAKKVFMDATQACSNDKEKAYSHANLAYSLQMCGELEAALKNYNIAIGIVGKEGALILQRANI